MIKRKVAPHSTPAEAVALERSEPRLKLQALALRAEARANYERRALGAASLALASGSSEA